MGGLDVLRDDIVECRACPRLVQWREQVAVEKRAAFRDEVYWGRPVPGWGDPLARIVIVGLAPAAHGANRTGRLFTGDRSGDWLYAALHRAGLASQASAVSSEDGLELRDTWVTASVKCAPPQNKPTVLERDTCVERYLVRELEVLQPRVLLCLGKLAYDVVRSVAGITRSPKFGHGVEATSPAGLHVVCSFHPSQQNTFTGKLTTSMLDAAIERAKQLATS